MAADEWVDLAATWKRKQTISKRTGKALAPRQYGIRYEATDLVINTSARDVVAEFAAGWLMLLRDEIAAVPEEPAQATRDRRERYARALRGDAMRPTHVRGSRGRMRRAPKTNAQKRYQERMTQEGGGSGLRTFTPNPAGNKFNDSLLLYDKVRIRPFGNLKALGGTGTATVYLDPPAARFDPRTGSSKWDARGIDNIIADAKRLIPLIDGRVTGATASRLDELLKDIARQSIMTKQAEVRRRQMELYALWLDMFGGGVGRAASRFVRAMSR